MNIKTVFNDSFWKSETICDYFVSEKKKKVWAVEIDLLNELLRVCRKHNIKVFVYAGTLLGAVRHNGFIPWDDDLDVCMDRENYEKLLSIASKEFSHPYFLQNAITDNQFFIGYSRLRNSDTTGIIKWNNSKDYNNGIYIDIVPMDGYIDNQKIIKKLFKHRARIERLIGIVICQPKGHSVKQIIKRFLKRVLKTFVGYQRLVAKYDKVLKTYNNKTNKITILSDSPIFSKYWCYKSDLLEETTIRFENIEVPIPKNYDAILKNLYGDYWILPPKEKRGEWHKGKIFFDPDTPYLKTMEKEIDFDKEI